MDTLPAQQTSQPPLREFLFHVHDQRRQALSIFAGILALALLAAAMLRPSYRANAMLAILPSPEFTVRASAGSHDTNASALAMDQIMKAEAELLSSGDLHADTLRHVGPSRVYPEVFSPAEPSLPGRILHTIMSVLLSPWRVTPTDPAASREEKGLRLFRHDLDILPSKDGNVISLSFDNQDSEVAADTLNTLLSLYAARRASLYTDPQLDIVRRDMRAAEQAVAAADINLAAFKQARQISDYEEERAQLLQRRGRADQAIADAQASVGEGQARLDTLTRQLSQEPAMVGLFREQDADTRLQAANAALQDLRAKLAAAADKYRDTSRMITMLRAQIAASQAEAARLARDPTVSVVRQGRNPSLDPLRLDQARAAVDLAASRARLEASHALRQDLSAALVQLDQDEAGLAALQRKKVSAEETYRETSRILADRSLSEAEDSRRLANVRIIQRAALPQKPRPLPLIVIGAGFVFGVLGALGWLVAAFAVRPVFMTGEGLEAATGIPVLAVFKREMTPATSA
jgi:uncharacterized protein involved in exopolysaccharide biosynthesis